MDAGKITNSGMSTTNTNRVLKKTDADDAAQINTADSFVSSSTSSKSESIEEMKKKLFQKKQDVKIDINPVWESEIPDYAIITSEPVIGKDGKVFVGTSDNTLLAFDPKDGNKIWSSKFEGPVESYIDISQSSIGPDGTIYANCCDKDIIALDPQNGQKKWSVSFDREISAKPVVTSDGAVISGDSEGKVYAINSNGETLWEKNVEKSVLKQLLAPGDGRIYIESSGALHALDEKTGKDLWKITNEAKSSFDGNTLAMGTNDTIYAATSKNDLYAIDSKNGDVKWKNKLKVDGILYNPSVDPKGETIFISSGRGKLYAINTKDGSEKWKFTDNSDDYPMNITPSISLPDGNVFFGVGYGKLYVLDPANGSIKMEKETKTKNLDRCVIKDNSIYYAANCNLAAFEIPDKDDDTQDQLQAGKPESNPQIKKEGDNVVIDGIKLPVRQNKTQQG